MTLRTSVMSLSCLVLLTVASGRPAETSEDPDRNSYDVVVYGGTSAGVIAAVQVARMGKSVVLVEPGRHVGGLTSGGLGATDIGNKAAIGGLSREFYRRIKAHYDHDAAWVHQTRDDYFTHSRRNRGGEDAMWTFEPHVAEQIYREMLKEHNVPVLFNQRLDLKHGVTKQGTRIVSIRMETGLPLRGTLFIDATYEGDLMAKAGVSCIVGRESNAQYDETLNGFQPRLNVKNHRFFHPVDPFVVPGDPNSGLLPRIHAGQPPEEGSGDHRVQAYCFRMCMTDAPKNRVPWPKPDNYDPQQFELLLRYYEAGYDGIPLSPTLMPNRKTDTNNNGAFSTDDIGSNDDYPEADYETRASIIREHENYQKGLMWTLAHNFRVPEKVRDYVNTWGLAQDEFTDNGHWPHQIYVREARRMVSDYVMTEHNCRGSRLADDAVGLAAYGMDSHNVQRYVDEAGRARNEGDIQVHGFSPYPIAYRSLRPKKSECSNLLVPVCVSASHIAYGSIRMEPVFMVLGQSAATAACHAVDENVAVQDVDVERLQDRLRADGQVLVWTGPKRIPPINPKALPGIVLDDRDAQLTGTWLESASVGGYVGLGYLHDNNANKGAMQAVFKAKIETSGRYEVRLYYTPHANRATNVPVTIRTADKTQTVSVNQKTPPKQMGYDVLAAVPLSRGDTITVTVSNADTNGYVILDAVQIMRREEASQ